MYGRKTRQELGATFVRSRNQTRTLCNDLTASITWQILIFMGVGIHVNYCLKVKFQQDIVTHTHSIVNGCKIIQTNKSYYVSQLQHQ